MLETKIEEKDNEIIKEIADNNCEKEEVVSENAKKIEEAIANSKKLEETQNDNNSIRPRAMSATASRPWRKNWESRSSFEPKRAFPSRKRGGSS